MIKKKGMPISGSGMVASKKKPFVPDAKETSSDEQRFISEPPTPFKNNMEPNSMAAPSGPRGAIPGPAKKPWSGLQHSSPGARALPNLSAVGQTKAINMSPQIGGKMGWPPPKRKAGVNGQGFPSKRSARFYGEG